MTDKLDVSEGRRLLKYAAESPADDYTVDVLKAEQWLWNNREALVAAAEKLHAIRQSPGAIPGETIDDSLKRHTDMFLAAYDSCDENGWRGLAHLKCYTQLEMLLVWRQEMNRLREERDRCLLEVQHLYEAFAGSGHSPRNPREAAQAIRQLRDGEEERELLEACVAAADAMAEFQNGYDFMPTDKAGRDLALFRAARVALDAHRAGKDST